MYFTRVKNKFIKQGTHCAFRFIVGESPVTGFTEHWLFIYDNPGKPSQRRNVWLAKFNWRIAYFITWAESHLYIYVVVWQCCS